MAKKKSSTPASSHAGKKFALPRSAAEMKAVEERLDKVLENIKAVRRGLEEGPLNEVVLKLGTFLYHLDYLEPLALEYRSTFEDEKATLLGRMKWEAIQAARASAEKSV